LLRWKRSPTPLLTSALADHGRDARVHLLPRRELLLGAEALLEPVRLLPEPVVLLLDGLTPRLQRRESDSLLSERLADPVDLRAQPFQRGQHLSGEVSH